MTQGRRTALDVLLDSGEVGRDILAVDWQASALGPPETWSASLTATLQIMLGSRFAMWMAWGPNLTFFCNDAYRHETLGGNYPWALGRPADEVWSEIWSDIGPRIEHVLRTGEATWDEDLLLLLERSGYREETYHTFSYSPVADDDGTRAGMLCVVSEETERVTGERRMTTLRELGGALAGVQDERSLYATIETVLTQNPYSLPFTALYVFDVETPDVARLVATSGIEWGHPTTPLSIAADADEPWPVAELGADEMLVVERLPERFPDLPAGAWDTPPTEAILVPLTGPSFERPLGFLVCAPNPYRHRAQRFDAFVALVGGQIAAALASARAFELQRERAEQLAEIDRAKTLFFTNVSHELRTPLTLLLGPAEDALADADEPLGAAQRERIERVTRNAQRLLGLVNTLLDFSRLEAGQAEPHREPVDLCRYTSELASMFESAVESAGLTMEIRCDGLDGPVSVDRDMWAKIVLNLLSNALKFTFEGSIGVHLRADGERAVLTVSDTGVGIDPAEQPKLFDRFHRVSGAQSRSHEGSGVGLALVAELAALHGGEVWVDSEVGVGSRFNVALPIEQPAERDVAGAPTAAAAAHAEGVLAEAMRWLSAGEATAVRRDGNRPRVLVVDDNADMRGYIAELLADAYDVEAAPDGVAALERVAARPPDLVITDVMMPRLDGFGLLDALRGDPDTMQIPVIMLSARAGEDGTVEGLEAGADDYLIKPFSTRELLARVRANLELDRVRRTRDELERNRDLLDQAERLAQVGSWEIDLRTGAVTGSAEYFRLLEADPEELQGGLEVALRYVHPDDAQRTEALVEHAVATRGSLDTELRILPSAGGERLARVRGVVRLGDDGQPAHLRGSIQDITEQRRAEQELALAAAEREAAAREHRIADELQRGLLPPSRFDTHALEVAAFYRAGAEGTQVGGDWYDAINLPRGRTALIVGDVMGRGVRAAAVMGQLRAAIGAYARLDLPPDQVLAHLDRVVADLDTDQIATSLYAVYDPADGTLTWANAGHMPAIVVSPDGRPQVLRRAGPPLGSSVFAGGADRIAIAPGSLLALYTDGLVERRDRDLVSGIDALAAALAADAEALETLPERLVRALTPDERPDDIAVLVARIAVAQPDA
jgi:signal transduction histidine kinase/DNA-binding response OmpR family regulator/serine phosphatase RsbU (regulator of sigma subunit)